MARYFRLALLKNLHEVTDANFPTAHQVKQPQPRRVGECSKEANEIEWLRASDALIIYALTDAYGKDIFALAYI